MQQGLSLQVRLIVLVAAALVPLVALSVGFALHEMQATEELAYMGLTLAASLFAAGWLGRRMVVRPTN